MDRRSVEPAANVGFHDRHHFLPRGVSTEMLRWRYPGKSVSGIAIGGENGDLMLAETALLRLCYGGGFSVITFQRIFWFVRKKRFNLTRLALQLDSFSVGTSSSCDIRGLAIDVDPVAARSYVDAATLPDRLFW